MNNLAMLLIFMFILSESWLTWREIQDGVDLEGLCLAVWVFWTAPWQYEGLCWRSVFTPQGDEGEGDGFNFISRNLWISPAIQNQLLTSAGGRGRPEQQQLPNSPKQHTHSGWLLTLLKTPCQALLWKCRKCRVLLICNWEGRNYTEFLIYLDNDL